MKKFCCQVMEENLLFECEEHPDPFDCPENLVSYSDVFDEYGLIIHDGGNTSVLISHCPWCGTAENSFADLTPYPLICPSCEKGVRPEWTACPWCFKGRFEGNGRRPPVDSRAERSCSARGCEGQLRPFMRYCPWCRTKVRRPWKLPESSHTCRSCDWGIAREYWNYCAWCREPIRRE